MTRAARAAGVTRVARVTGLDRAGVEVATAIRPAGHVLQVSNGKGDGFADAATGAVLEAVELDAAERARVDAFGAATALAAAGARVLRPERLDGGAAGA
ncbi:MAG TPA: fatty acid-binding protein, partial [Anaeromyxobacteraceae bacterium]|nr:fatty acid-binding protein [Anaeromyxobacteraceae bacterium]